RFFWRSGLIRVGAGARGEGTLVVARGDHSPVRVGEGTLVVARRTLLSSCKTPDSTPPPRVTCPPDRVTTRVPSPHPHHPRPYANQATSQRAPQKTYLYPSTCTPCYWL